MLFFDRTHINASPINEVVVRQFASRVVSELTRPAGIESGRPEQPFVQRIVAMARSGGGDDLPGIRTEMKRRRITAEQFTDIYLPAAIEVIGTSWHEAQMTVLDATVALSRLQVLLREMGRAWQSDWVRGGATGCVLLVQPEGEQHSLGAMLAANQMRRLGVSVRVELMMSAQSARSVLANRHFDAVFLSVSNESAVPAGAHLISAIRQESRRAFPVVVGGGLIRMVKGSDRHRTIAHEFGADLAATDIHEAVSFSGLERFCVAAE